MVKRTALPFIRAIFKENRPGAGEGGGVGLFSGMGKLRIWQNLFWSVQVIWQKSVLTTHETSPCLGDAGSKGGCEEQTLRRSQTGQAWLGIQSH